MKKKIKDICLFIFCAGLLLGWLVSFPKIIGLLDKHKMEKLHYHKYEIVDLYVAVSGNIFGQTNRVVIGYLKNGFTEHEELDVSVFHYSIGDESYIMLPCLKKRCKTEIKGTGRVYYVLSREMVNNLHQK